MAQARVHESPAARQAAYRARQTQERAAQLQAKGLPSLPAMPTVPGQARWNALLHQTYWALKTAREEMEDYAAARSENWQESERGEEFAERLAAFQEVMDALEELTSAPEKT